MSARQIQPALSYIHRNAELVNLQTRILPELKEEAEHAAEQLGTSLNRLVEGALKWYLIQLKKEGSI